MLSDGAVEGTINDENGREIAPATPRDIAPSDAQTMLAQLRASGLSLAEIAGRTDIARRTLDDMEYGRSSGARILPQLRPLYEVLQQKQAERRGRHQIHRQGRTQSSH